MPAQIQFLKEFLLNPTRVGAVAPSSARLARSMLNGIDLAGAETVLELGPGTGALTREILPRIGPHTFFLAIEFNDTFVAQLRERFPDLRVHTGNAVEAPAILAENGRSHADVIVSGLPWASFPPELQDALLGAILESLPPGGRFVTFAYSGAARLPKGRRFRKLLERSFERVELRPTVWRNLPPAFAYQCTKGPLASRED